MFKNAFWVSASIALLATLVCGGETLSYLSTACGLVKSKIRSNIPLSFEVQRARKMVDELAPTIDEYARLIAQTESELESLLAGLERQPNGASGRVQLEQLAAAKRLRLSRARGTLQELLSAKQQLSDRAALLAARHAALTIDAKLSGLSSASRLARPRQLLADLEQQLEVQERLAQRAELRDFVGDNERPSALAAR
jgi:hypothetical protein